MPQKGMAKLRVRWPNPPLADPRNPFVRPADIPDKSATPGIGKESPGVPAAGTVPCGDAPFAGGSAD